MTRVRIAYIVMCVFWQVWCFSLGSKTCTSSNTYMISGGVFLNHFTFTLMMVFEGKFKFKY